MNESSFAEFSNLLVYGAMAVLVLTVVVFAVDFAVGSGKRRALTADRRRRQALVAVPAGSDSVGVAVTDTEPPDPDIIVDERWARVGVSLSVLAMLLLAAAVLTRGLAVHRPPWGNMYEFALAGTTAALATWLFLVKRRSEVRELGLIVSLFALLVLGFAVTILYTDASQLMVALQSYWLWIHVTAAITASGIFTIGAVASLLFLFADRYERRAVNNVSGSSPSRKQQSRVGSSGSHVLDAIGKRLPSASSLDRVAFQTIAFAFPIWFFAIVAGAIWAEHAWSRYWGWDPKETWSFITLVIYAAYLHARSTAGWRGRPAATIALVGYSAFLFSFIGVNIFFFGLHSYSGI